jgi:hypothetical protein
MSNVDTRLLRRWRPGSEREQGRPVAPSQPGEEFLDALAALRRRIAEQKAALEAQGTRRLQRP